MTVGSRKGFLCGMIMELKSGQPWEEMGPECSQSREQKVQDHRAGERSLSEEYQEAAVVGVVLRRQQEVQSEFGKTGKPSILIWSGHRFYPKYDGKLLEQGRKV